MSIHGNCNDTSKNSKNLQDMAIKIIEDGSNTTKEKTMKKKFFCKNTKRKKQQPFSSGEVFKFSDYDCIGFDLDNTICRYKVGPMMRLEYKLIAEYLVNEYGYDQSLLLPLDDDIDFLQKGIVMDIKRGNFLKCSSEGVILRATHGTQPITRTEVVEIYGKDKIWDPILKFAETLVDKTHRGHIRSFKDYFDLPGAVACARAIDAEDRLYGHHQSDEYDVWSDVHAAMCSLYRRESFRSDEGGFFPEMKKQPECYMYETSEKTRKWLRALNEHTYTMLISGSSIDYASHISQYVLGPDWRDYFDMVVFTAKKPVFFTGNSPFREIDGIDDGDEVSPHNLDINGTYANGNWNDLATLIKGTTGTDDPHFLYVGDHLCQDILAPSSVNLDTVAIVEEMAAEGVIGDPLVHEDGPDLMSMYWGSFFTTDGNIRARGTDRINTLFGSVPQKYARLSIPFLDVVAKHQIKHSYSAFTKTSSGFYPGDPVVLHF